MVLDGSAELLNPCYLRWGGRFTRRGYRGLRETHSGSVSSGEIHRQDISGATHGRIAPE